MAKQKGIIQLEGTIAGITFFKTADGYMAKAASSVSAKRIATDPSYQRTRENTAEFGRAGKAASLLRNVFRTKLVLVKDQRMFGRLAAEMMKVIKADSTSVRGMRNVIDGEIELLQGFDFNGNCRLASTLYAPFEADIDRVTGQCSASFDGFVPAQSVSAPAGATHFRISTLAAEIDFETGVYTTESKDTDLLPLNNTPTAAIKLDTALPANSIHPLFFAVGVEFLQIVNGEYYQLNNGAHNALSLVKISGL